jgi:hypothetical protein
MGLFTFVSSSYQKIEPKYWFKKKIILKSLKIEFFGSNFW